MKHRAGGVARGGEGSETATSEELRRDPRWNQCSSEYWKTSVRAEGEKDRRETPERE
jgi:hypothetical protein